MTQRINFVELFSGAGLVLAGLGERWRCCFAIDDDPDKQRAYSLNFSLNEFRLGDVASLTHTDLPAGDLLWMSPPCISVSSAGKRDGMAETKRGTGAIWPGLRLVGALAKDGRAPRVVVVENVPEILSDRDWPSIVEALVGAGYRLGALVIDARRFVPQSRERAFVVAVRGEIPIDLLSDSQMAWRAPPVVASAHAALSADLRRAWVWWRLPEPSVRTTTLADVFDSEADGWVDLSLSELGPAARTRAEKARANGGRWFGTCFRRTREPTPDQPMKSRWETRSIGEDDIAGALRVATGGSSRQSWLRIESGRIERRVMTPREAARLMGLPDSFRLPTNANEALSAIGDGVAAPVTRHLAEGLLEPLLAAP